MSKPPHSQNKDQLKTATEAHALGFPVASLCLVLLNIKTEHSLTHLRTFMSALEQLGDAHKHLPSYNSDPTWAAGTNGMRRRHDYIAAMLVAASHAVCMGALWRIYPNKMGWQSPKATNARN